MEDAFNMSMRKFLKEVGVTSQREIERIVRESMLSGEIHVKMVLTAEETNLCHVVEGVIHVDSGAYSPSRNAARTPAHPPAA